MNRPHYVVQLDGDPTQIQAFTDELERALRHFARGFAASRLQGCRSALPARVSTPLREAVRELAQDLIHFIRLLGPGVVVNSYVFERTGLQTVDTVLTRLTRTLIQWRNNGLDAATALEETHTGLEIALKSAMNGAMLNESFDSMVAAAEAKYLISAEEANCLRSLKQLRKNAKHRGQRVSSSALEEVLGPAVGVLHRLAVRIADGAPCVPIAGAKK